MIDKVNELFNTIKQSVSKDNSRPILKWIRCEVFENKLTAITCDGYALSTFSIEFNEQTKILCEEFKVVFLTNAQNIENEESVLLHHRRPLKNFRKIKRNIQSFRRQNKYRRISSYRIR